MRMSVRRLDLPVWLIAVILLHAFVQVHGDITTVEETTEDETKAADEENLPTTSPTISEGEGEGEEDSNGVSEDNVSPKETASTESLETTKTTAEVEVHFTSEKSVTAKESGVAREVAPASAFAIWNSKGKICLLATFKASFTIKYQTEEKEQHVTESLPEDAKVQGECTDNNKKRILTLLWSTFSFSMIFSKVSKHDDSEAKWAVKELELRYDTSNRPFVSALNGGNVTARGEKQIFETPLGKSYSCPSPDVIKLNHSKKEAVTVKFQDVQLQPFGVKQGKFGPFLQCTEAIFTEPEEPFVQDETVPLAVGLTLAILTLLVVLGFSIYRAYTVRKVDYNSME